MSTARWSPRVERFPSLVEAVLPEAEKRWRALEADMELKGELPGQRAPGGNRPHANSKALAIRDEAQALREQGKTDREIAQELEVSPDTVKRSIGKGVTDRQETPHGTQYRYGALGCRCARCTEANAKHCREYKKRRREKRRAELGIAQLAIEVAEVQVAVRDAAAKRAVRLEAAHVAGGSR